MNFKNFIKSPMTLTIISGVAAILAIVILIISVFTPAQPAVPTINEPVSSVISQPNNLVFESSSEVSSEASSEASSEIESLVVCLDVAVGTDYLDIGICKKKGTKRLEGIDFSVSVKKDNDKEKKYKSNGKNNIILSSLASGKYTVSLDSSDDFDIVNGTVQAQIKKIEYKENIITQTQVVDKNKTDEEDPLTKPNIKKEEASSKESSSVKVNSSNKVSSSVKQESSNSESSSNVTSSNTGYIPNHITVPITDKNGNYIYDIVSKSVVSREEFSNLTKNKSEVKIYFNNKQQKAEKALLVLSIDDILFTARTKLAANNPAEESSSEESSSEESSSEESSSEESSSEESSSEENSSEESSSEENSSEESSSEESSSEESSSEESSSEESSSKENSSKESSSKENSSKESSSKESSSKESSSKESSSKENSSKENSSKESSSKENSSKENSSKESSSKESSSKESSSKESSSKENSSKENSSSQSQKNNSFLKEGDYLTVKGYIIKTEVHTYGLLAETATDIAVFSDGQTYILKVKAVTESKKFTQGFFTKDNKTYYLKADSTLATNWYNINLRRHFFSDKGVLSSVHGIDVSSYQNKADKNNKIYWDKVAKDDIEFAIIRAGFRGYGTGVNKIDSFCEENIKGAQAAGLNVGLYFFSQAINVTEAAEEASILIDLAKKYNIKMPLVIDVELIGVSSARADKLTAAQRTTVVKAFCETVKKAGYEPMIYTGQSFYSQGLNSNELTGYKLWIARYPADAKLYETPNISAKYHIWQYASDGKVDGITGDVDMNSMIIG